MNSKKEVPVFILNKPVDLEEDLYTEFKEIKPDNNNPVKSIVNTMARYAVAFLNTKGGSVYWGIRDDDHVVIGVQLDKSSRDKIRKGIFDKCHNNIQPPLDPSSYDLIFHPIKETNDILDLYIVEISFKYQPYSDPFYLDGTELHIRTNGTVALLKGQSITNWMKRKLNLFSQSLHPIENPQTQALVNRIKDIFSKHGLEPAHLSSFLQQCKAPFSIDLTDTQSDTAFLHWLDNDKINWITKTFLIRPEWINGEDNQIYEYFPFDKNLKFFSDVIKQHVDSIDKEINESPYVHFIRWGIGKQWKKQGQSRVFVILAFPIASVSNEKVIYKYISDFQPYPWDYPRTNIQLRAWTRLLTVNDNFYISRYEVSYEIGQLLYSNMLFIRDMLENHRKPFSDDWHPDDYARYSEESVQAKDLETFPLVIEFLKSNGLPWENTSRRVSKD